MHIVKSNLVQKQRSSAISVFVGGQATGTYRFLSGFYGVADMSAEFQKARDRTLNHAKNTFCFLDDILIVSKRDEKEQKKLVLEVLKKLDDKNLALKISK